MKCQKDKKGLSRLKYFTIEKYIIASINLHSYEIVTCHVKYYIYIYYWNYVVCFARKLR